MRVKQYIPMLFVALTLGVLVLVSFVPASNRTAFSHSSNPAVTSACPGASMAPTAQLPISFEANQGQANSQARFLAHGPGYSFLLTPQEALLALDSSRPAAAVEDSPFAPALADPGALASASGGAVVGMQFLNANPQPEITGEQPLPGVVNYLLGNNPANWHTNIPTYTQVRYHNIYPGIDLIFYGSQGHLEYDFVVSPGSDPSQIHLNFTGANRLSLDAQHALLLHLSSGDLSEGAPVIYQEINGARQQVASRYVLQGATEVGFALGHYDASQPLVIDPSVFFSTYLGGSGNDYVKSIAIDSSCNIYLTGATNSTDFHTTNALQGGFGGGSDDAFVTKISADGSTLLYSTYLGGSGSDWGNGIAVDSAGNAYITGVTFSSDFPTQNALQSAFGTNAIDNAFVAELNAAGTGLTYSTYLGGNNGMTWGNDIAVDSAGNAYVTGGTSSTSFPTQNALHASLAGNANAFVAEVAAGGASLVYSTYLGGSNYDYGASIVVDSAGDAYITGTTHSSNFPTHNPLQSSYQGGGDAFVAKVGPNGTPLVYSTYLGGSGADSGYGIAVDSAGNAYVTGSTSSTNFPTHAPLQASNAGSTDAFVAKINPAGSALVYSTYLGGSNTDEASSIVVDSAGNAYITGSTSSTNFPLQSALQTSNAGGADAFVARLNAAGSLLLYSSYLGGSGNDWGASIAVDGVGYVYIVGATASSNFPTANPIQSYGGMEDGFLAKMNLMAPAQFHASKENIALTTTPGVNPSPVSFTLSDPGDAPLNWSANSLPSWVSVSPSSGFLPGGSAQTLTLTFNISNTPQVYTTNLVLTDPNAANSPFSIPVTVVAANVSKTWYFAEGFTGGSFTEYLTLANPNPSATTATVQYLLQGASPITKRYTLAANSRTTLNVDNEVGKGKTLSMVVTGSQPIIAERPMYFTYTTLPGYTIPGGSDVLGATSLSTNFDFGYLDTTKGHDTYLTILNQNSTAMQVTVDYFPAGGGTPIVRTHSVAATSRGTIHVNTDGLAAGTYSALVTLSEPGLVERPMYLKDSGTGYTGSADVVGVANPQNTWYFAEGFVSSLFQERYIVANPSTTTAAHVTLTFFLASGKPQTATFTLNPGQQEIYNVGGLLSGNNSAQVSSTGAPVLAERFMSFKYESQIPGASDVLGAAAPSQLFYFAEGYTGSTFSEYLTIENPNSSSAIVQVTFLPANGGAPKVETYTIAASSRFTLNTGDVMSNQAFSMVVESNVPIVAERPMYFNYLGSGQTGGTDVIGYQP